MKKFIAAALSLTALATLAGGAFAQDKVRTDEMNGKKIAVVTTDASKSDYEKARWAFFHADKYEVNRFKAMGFSESDFKAIANIALRSGLSTEYVARQVREVGTPLSFVAAQYGVPTTALSADIPGFGATSFGVESKDTTVTMTTPATMDTTSAAASASMPGSVIDVAMADPQFSTFVTAVRAAGLANTLQGTGPFTIFAPTNDAFAKLPTGALDDLLKTENKDKLVAILTYHVVPGKLKAADVMAMTNPSTATTLGGKTLNITNGAPIMIGNASIVRSDIEASNGVIHAIDTVLMPDTSTVTPATPEAPVPAPPTPTPPTPLP